MKVAPWGLHVAYLLGTDVVLITAALMYSELNFKGLHSGRLDTSEEK